MSRYIDADVLKRYIDDCDVCTNCKEKKLSCDIDCPMPDCLTKDWERVIDEQPTVDAVPVSYIYERAMELKDNDMMYAYTVLNSLLANYRADGERRTDDD